LDKRGRRVLILATLTVACLLVEEALMEWTWVICTSAGTSELEGHIRRFSEEHGGRIPRRAELYDWAAKSGVTPSSRCIMGEYLWELPNGPHPNVLVHCRRSHGFIQRRVNAVFRNLDEGLLTDGNR